MSDLQEAAETLADIEQQFPVNTLRYRRTCIWPILRIHLWSQLTHGNNSYSGGSKRTSGGSEQRNVFNRVREKLRKGYSLAGDITSLCADAFQFSDSLQFDSLHRSVDLLFWSRPIDYSDQFRGLYYNRHLDPLLELVSSERSCRKLEFLSKRTSQTMPRVEPATFLFPHRQWYQILKHGFRMDRDPLKTMDGRSDFLTFLSETHPSVSVNWNVIRFRVKRMQLLSEWFYRILNRMDPSAIFLVCYYDGNFIPMSLIRAAKRAGIPTVDVQHGKQGKYQGAYTHWTAIPEGGYELLPDYFWAWGEESKRNIQKWFPDGVETHQPVVGGNRWLAKWQGDSVLRTETGVQQYMDEYDSYQKRILVSLQPFLETLPDHLLKAMKEGPDDWFWMLRLHPRQRDEIPDYRRLCETHDIHNFEIHRASHLPLYALLYHTDHHVTCYSSVCYEALTFDVPTTIIHEIGENLYTEYIEKNHFLLALTSEDLLRSIKNGRDTSVFQEETPYIETEEDVARSAFSRILQ